LSTPQESVNADVHVRIHLLTTGRFLTILPESLVQFAAKRWAIKALPIDLGARRAGAAAGVPVVGFLSPVSPLMGWRSASSCHQGLNTAAGAFTPAPRRSCRRQPRP
jgi:hypothetical protein